MLLVFSCLVVCLLGLLVCIVFWLLAFCCCLDACDFVYCGYVIVLFSSDVISI